MVQLHPKALAGSEPWLTAVWDPHTYTDFNKESCLGWAVLFGGSVQIWKGYWGVVVVGMVVVVVVMVLGPNPRPHACFSSAHSPNRISCSEAET